MFFVGFPCFHSGVSFSLCRWWFILASLCASGMTSMCPLLSIVIC